MLVIEVVDNKENPIKTTHCSNAEGIQRYRDWRKQNPTAKHGFCALTDSGEELTDVIVLAHNTAEAFHVVHQSAS